MLKRKRIACGLTSAAITTSILLGAVMPGVVMADEVTILDEKFEGTDLAASGWSTEDNCSGQWEWVTADHDTIMNLSEGEVDYYTGKQSAYIEYDVLESGNKSYLISPALDLSDYSSVDWSFVYINKK